tara:strand:- start:280 stop:1200 length:921 start_codon:yes stop_codon:yes gene_type:complete
MKGGSKLYHYIFFGKEIRTKIDETVEKKLEKLIELFPNSTIALPLNEIKIKSLKDLDNNHKYLFNIPIMRVLKYFYKNSDNEAIQQYLTDNKDNIETELDKDKIEITKDQKEKIIARMIKIADFASFQSSENTVSEFKEAFNEKIRDNLEHVVLMIHNTLSNIVYNFMVHFIMKDFDKQQITEDLKKFTFAKLLSKMHERGFEDGISCFPLFGNPDILLFYLLTYSDSGNLVKYLSQLKDLVNFILGENRGSMNPEASLPFLQKTDFDRIYKKDFDGISGFDDIYSTLDFQTNLRVLNDFKIKLSK